MDYFVSGKDDSYQDANWGHTPDELGEPQLTDSAVSFTLFQTVLNTLGYFLSHHDQDRPILHWKNKETNELITTLKPDFKSESHSNPVYDRDYLIDLIVSINGDGRSEAGFKILAVLRTM